MTLHFSAAPSAADAAGQAHTGVTQTHRAGFRNLYSERKPTCSVAPCAAWRTK